MQVQSNTGYVVQDDYSNLETGGSRKSSYAKILYALGFIVLIGATVGIVLAVTGDSDGDSDGSFTHSFRLLDEDAELQAVTLEPGVSTTGLNEQDLYKPQTELVFEYSITNNFDSDKRVAIRETPLEPGEITTNFVSHLVDVFYGGDNTESAGTFVETVTIKAGQTEVVTMDFEKNLLFEGPGQVGVSIAYTLYVLEGDATKLTDDMEHYSVVTDQVELILSAGESKTLPDPEDDSGRRTLEAVLYPRRNLGGLGVDANNIPYFEWDCVDKPEKTGWSYTPSGNPIPCKNLKDKCETDHQVKTWCPSECGGCADLQLQWTHPKESKSASVQMYQGTIAESCKKEITNRGETKTQEEWIRQAETEKDKYCSTVLWHIQNKGAELRKQFDLWFGEIDDTRFERLKSGFTKMCSADRYKYNCNPSAGMADDRCRINFSWQGNTYSDWRQQDLAGNKIDDEFIAQCNSPTGCSYSGVVAWVSTGQTFDRVINVCPIGFWIQKDVQSADLNSKAAVILHELSHFVDIADTTDLTYNIQEMLQWADKNTKEMLDNAASWDNFGEDPSWPAKDWSDFASMENGGGAGGNDEVVEDKPEPAPTPPDDPEPQPDPKPVQYTVRSSIHGAKCVGDSKDLAAVSGSDNGWVECAYQVLADSECGHMYYTDNTNCACVKEGYICNERTSRDYNIFVLVPSGECEDLTWTDVDGSTCSDYLNKQVCKSGSVVGDVTNSCSTNSDCKKDGKYADDACCACGGGRIV